jgi:hypothetical protein
MNEANMRGLKERKNDVEVYKVSSSQSVKSVSLMMSDSSSHVFKKETKAI